MKERVKTSSCSVIFCRLPLRPNFKRQLASQREDNMNNSSSVSKKAAEIPSFIVMDVLEAAKAMEMSGIDVVHLEVGEPDFETPAAVKKAAIEAIEKGDTRYTHSMGMFELRNVICAHYQKKYGVSVDPEQVVVTNGSSPALFLAFASLLNPGDEVVLSDPHYASYPPMVQFCDGVPVYSPVAESEAFQFDPKVLEQKLGSRVKAVVVNSPSNPTGTLIQEDRFREIAKKTEASGAYIISDEIYHGLVYEGRDHCALEFTDRAFVVSGFSKLYSMTGWRLGYVIAPKQFVRPIQKIQQNFFISANAFVQQAGIAALTSTAEEVDQMVRTYDQRRRYMLNRLEGMGFSFKCRPTGAFYIFANSSHLAEDCYELAFDILKKAHVGCTPGIDFGSVGQKYLRFAYANSMANIKKGMDRLESYVKEFNR